MIEIRNSETLQRWLLESGHLGRLWDRPRFLFDRDEFEREVAGVRAQYPQFSAGEAEARAALRLLGKEEGRARAVVIGGRRHWTRRERIFLTAVVLLAAALALLLFVPRAHAQERGPSPEAFERFRFYRRADHFGLAGGAYRADYFGLARGAYRADQSGGQPGGLIVQVQNQGSTLATRPAGLLVFNCSTNLSCSFSGTTFTMTASSSSSTAWSALTAGTNSSAGTFAGSGNTWDFTAATLFKLRVGAGLTTSVNGDCGYDSTAGRWHCWQGGADRLDIMATNVGASGQPCMSNADGSCTFADPIVSGPDAVGAAPTKNPVQIGALFLTTPATLTNNQVGSLQLDATQNLLVKLNVNPTIANTGFNVNNSPTVNQGGAPWSVSGSGNFNVIGTRTNNNAAPGATNAGVLPCLANASNPSWTEGNQVTCSADLSGNQRVLVNSWLGSAAPTVGSKTSANSIPIVPASDWVDTATGNKSDNGAAAGANRVNENPGIYQTDYRNGAAGTQGNDAALQVATDGLLQVAALPAMRPASYTASAKFAASSTTDNAVLPGNASNTVLVTELRVSCVQTTAGIINVEIAKRSTADTSGTSAAMTKVPDDSNYPAAASAPLSYTGTGPTVGTLVGDVDNNEFGCMAPGASTANDIYVLNLRQKPIVLRGTAQQLAVNLGGAVTGGTITVTFKWIETKTITP